MGLTRRELVGSETDALLIALEGWQAGIWTACPAIVLSFNPNARTLEVQPSIQAQVTNPDGSTQWVNLPPLVDCPVFFPRGGNVELTFPIKPGDEVLVVFSSRCIDNWWAFGGVQNQAQLRMHDLSDGFCFPCTPSRASALLRPPVSMDGAELRTLDGTSRVRLSESGNLAANVTGSATVAAAGAASVSAGGTLTLAGATVNITGVLNINGEAYTAHRHTGVTPGASNTGGKTP